MGVKFSVAAEVIERENPNVKAQKIQVGSPRILNFNPSRVWVDVDDDDIVVLVPIIG